MVAEPDAGTKAPGFSLPDQDGKDHSLDGFSGSWFILYFYPKDNTSACTAEALAFSAVYEDLQELGVPVVGVSPDSPASHKKFIEKHDLKLLLLSDESHAVAEAYGVWKMKKMYGKEYMGIERSTFIIDSTGTIREIWRKVKVKGHVEDVRSRLDALRG